MTATANKRTSFPAGLSAKVIMDNMPKHHGLPNHQKGALGAAKTQSDSMFDNDEGFDLFPGYGNTPKTAPAVAPKNLPSGTKERANGVLELDADVNYIQAIEIRIPQSLYAVMLATATRTSEEFALTFPIKEKLDKGYVEVVEDYFVPRQITSTGAIVS